jgi:zinc D-Ala-D-Ala carboxypeptidase
MVAVIASRKGVVVSGLRKMLMATVLIAGSVGVVQAATSQPVAADGCYTWSRTLSAGATGNDVKELQIRIAGFAASHDVVVPDGAFGQKISDALRRFQASYGLTADGVAGTSTYNKIYALQDDDCSPIHFDFSEFYNDCSPSQGFNGGPISATAVKTNVMRLMWKLEALRHKLGDRPITVTSGFRNNACNASVGGSSNSQHRYGTAADLVGLPLCTLASGSRTAGLSGIIGPGSPDGNHEDHTHVDSRYENAASSTTFRSFYWSAPRCGIATQS